MQKRVRQYEFLVTQSANFSTIFYRSLPAPSEAVSAPPVTECRSRVCGARASLRYTRSLIRLGSPVYSVLASERRSLDDFFSVREWHVMKCPETRTWGAAGPRGAWDCPQWTGPPAGPTLAAAPWAVSRCGRRDRATILRTTLTATTILPLTTGTRTSPVPCWRREDALWLWDLAITAPGALPGRDVLHDQIHLSESKSSWHNNETKVPCSLNPSTNLHSKHNTRFWIIKLLKRVYTENLVLLMYF